MDLETVTSKVIEVIKSIGRDSGCEEAPVDETTRPINDLSWFDSLMWPVSMSLLADELGMEIPDDVNIYKSEKGDPLSTREAAARLIEILHTKGV